MCTAGAVVCLTGLLMRSLVTLLEHPDQVGVHVHVTCACRVHDVCMGMMCAPVSGSLTSQQDVKTWRVIPF